MVGLASCIIVFAVLLYANDVRDRLQENSDGNDNKSDSEIVEGATSVPDPLPMEREWVLDHLQCAQSLPPPIPLIATKISRPLSVGRCLYLSRLSTMTESMKESSWSFECR